MNEYPVYVKQGEKFVKLNSWKYNLKYKLKWFVRSFVGGVCLGTILCFVPPIKSQAKVTLIHESDVKGTINKPVQKKVEISKPLKKYTIEDIHWLAMNIYFEVDWRNVFNEEDKKLADLSRKQAETDAEDISFVVINRSKDKRFPNTIKGVVTQNQVVTYKKIIGYNPCKTKKNCKVISLDDDEPNGLIKNKKTAWQVRRCQFSWYSNCDDKPDTITNKQKWNMSVKVAKNVLNGKSIDRTQNALWYISSYINYEPVWTKNLLKVVDKDFGHKIWGERKYTDDQLSLDKMIASLN